MGDLSRIGNYAQDAEEIREIVTELESLDRIKRNLNSRSYSDIYRICLTFTGKQEINIDMRDDVNGNEKFYDLMNEVIDNRISELNKQLSKEVDEFTK